MRFDIHSFDVVDLLIVPFDYPLRIFLGFKYLYELTFQEEHIPYTCSKYLSSVGY